MKTKKLNKEKSMNTNRLITEWRLKKEAMKIG